MEKFPELLFSKPEHDDIYETIQNAINAKRKKNFEFNIQVFKLLRVPFSNIDVINSIVLKLKSIQIEQNKSYNFLVQVTGHGVNKHYVPISVISNKKNELLFLNLDNVPKISNSFNFSKNDITYCYNTTTLTSQVGYNGCGADGICQLYKVHKMLENNKINELFEWGKFNNEDDYSFRLPPLELFRLTEHIGTNAKLIKRIKSLYDEKQKELYFDRIGNQLIKKIKKNNLIIVNDKNINDKSISIDDLHKLENSVFFYKLEEDKIGIYDDILLNCNTLGTNYDPKIDKMKHIINQIKCGIQIDIALYNISRLYTKYSNSKSILNNTNRNCNSNVIALYNIPRLYTKHSNSILNNTNRNSNSNAIELREISFTGFLDNGCSVGSNLTGIKKDPSKFFEFEDWESKYGLLNQDDEPDTLDQVWQ